MESILALLLALAMVPFQPGGGEWGYGEGTLRNEWVRSTGEGALEVPGKPKALRGWSGEVGL